MHAGRRADFFCGVYQLETSIARIINRSYHIIRTYFIPVPGTWYSRVAALSYFISTSKCSINSKKPEIRRPYSCEKGIYLSQFPVDGEHLHNIPIYVDYDYISFILLFYTWLYFQAKANYNRTSYPKSENKTGFPFIVLKPASSAVGSDGSLLFTA